MHALSAAVETLDSPFQSEKGLFQEIDGELRRPGRAALLREPALLISPLLGGRAVVQSVIQIW
jgi:hypothetical protein